MGFVQRSTTSRSTTATTSNVQPPSRRQRTSRWWSSVSPRRRRASSWVTWNRCRPRCSPPRTSPRSSSGSTPGRPPFPRSPDRRDSAPASRRSERAAIASRCVCLERDVELVRAVARANPRTVVVIQSGSAVVCSEWVDDVPAIVQAWYGGAEAGPALTDVLTGTTEPSGRLPFSVPHDEADLPDVRPRRRRGHLRPLARMVAPGPHRASGDVPVRVRPQLHDARARRGDGRPGRASTSSPAASCGTADPGTAPTSSRCTPNLPSSEHPPRLIGFTRVQIPAGDEAEFRIEAPVDRLAVRDPDAHAWRPAVGRHRITVARCAGDDAAAATDLEL